jgi:hypothetical protein
VAPLAFPIRARFVFAGVFLGKVRVTGSLSKGGGGFEIDHPLDPENKYLSHSFAESPDMLNVYNGTVTTDGNGEAAGAGGPRKTSRTRLQREWQGVGEVVEKARWRDAAEPGA